MNITDLLSAKARVQPDAPAIISSRASLSYSEFDRAVSWVAQKYRKNGVEPGDTVGIQLSNQLQKIIASMAFARLGAVQIPISKSDPLRIQIGLHKRLGLDVVVSDSGAFTNTEISTISGPPEDFADYKGIDPVVEERLSNDQTKYLIVATSGTTSPEPKLGLLSHEAAAINLALALNGTGRNREAAEVCTKALVLHPMQAALHTNLGVAHWYLGEHRAAVAGYRRSLAIQPDDAQTIYNLGLALEVLGEHKDAAGQLRRAVELVPKSADYLSGYGQSLISLGDIPSAVEAFKFALAEDANNLDAHLGTARANLLSGHLTAGFEEYVWHRRRTVNTAPDLSSPAWDGSDPAGKTILVYGEQGFGDTIQNARYIPLLEARGARVILSCHISLTRLLGTLAGGAEIIDQNTPVPDHDAHVPIMEFPRLFDTALDTIPADCPYLSPPEGNEISSPKRIFRTGIVWSGSDRHPKNGLRSMALDDLAPLFNIPGLIVFSLQTGEAAEDIGTSDFGHLLQNTGSDLTDFAHTADVLRQLDLLITADTAIAHLAGALALPVWVLLPFAPDWRWMLRRSDSPWYPTMRLFRQPAPGDWAGAIESATEALVESAAEKIRSAGEGE